MPQHLEGSLVTAPQSDKSGPPPNEIPNPWQCRLEGHRMPYRVQQFTVVEIIAHGGDVTAAQPDPI